jgi:hypothetical protein
MKIFFVSICQKGKINSGVEQCSNRNFEALQSYFGEDNVEFIAFQQTNKCKSRKNTLARFKNLIFCRYHIESLSSERKLINAIIKSDFVFLDNSIYGILAKKLKRKSKDIRIVSFFHNIESDNISQAYANNFLHRLIRNFVILKNEFWICKYSNAVIALNSRDAGLIEKLYNRKVDAIIPISNSSKSLKFSDKPIDKIPLGLFLGTNFFANVSGISWFIEKVLPSVNMKLKIVGRDMDKAILPRSEKTEVFGYIENLDECIQEADFMVYPIFQGGGMKVKTCDALMYGKNIIGTGEAFEGYDIDFERVGAKCETAEEFIREINEFPKRFTNKFNEYSRSVFLEKYSNEVTFKQFAEVFENVYNNKNSHKR